MSLAFDETAAGGAQTHALVIGVGGYRHLLGGSEERQQIFRHAGLLKQLTSPPRSAVAIAEWLVRRKDDLAQPLGSIDLLVSAPPSDDEFTTNGLTARLPTIANIFEAYDSWRNRCDSEVDNIAIFYFCGHGLEKVDQHLLAEDFGATPNNPWTGSFAFNATRVGFFNCRARMQCFFSDACRKITSAMLNSTPTVIPLEINDFNGVECDHSLSIQAAAGGEEALGPKSGVSYFAQALIRAFEGGAARNSAGKWVVDTGEVASRITDIIRMVNKSEGFAQRCDARVTASTRLLKVKQAPNVPIAISCIPDAANAVASLSFEPLDLPGDPRKQEGAPWELEVPAGFYKAKARFSNGGFNNREDTVIAFPPSQIVQLQC